MSSPDPPAPSENYRGFGVLRRSSSCIHAVARCHCLENVFSELIPCEYQLLTRVVGTHRPGFYILTVVGDILEFTVDVALRLIIEVR